MERIESIRIMMKVVIIGGIRIGVDLRIHN
jgi:hypothetical protein